MKKKIKKNRPFALLDFADYKHVQRKENLTRGYIANKTLSIIRVLSHFSLLP